MNCQIARSPVRTLFGAAMRRLLPALAMLKTVAFGFFPLVAAAQERPAPPKPVAPKKVVLIAGKKSHGPEGNGMHDYGWSVRLLKVMLDNSNISDRVAVEYHLDGWPEDQQSLETADTIMIVSDGRDGELFEEALHLQNEERIAFVGRQMARGCGLLTFHFSTFAPDKYAQQMLDWCGGYFDWETDGARKWYSAITTLETKVEVATAEHPVARGLTGFTMREEFYYNMRFRPEDKGLAPLWVVPSLDGREPDGRVVAWARQRPDGGRGFATTAGHFYDNWRHQNFRKLILNALAWTAKVDVPAEGVDARYYTHAEITAALSGRAAHERALFDEAPLRVLILAGNEAHKWHNWEKTTLALEQLLRRDSRVRVTVSNDIEALAKVTRDSVDVIVQNYCNWQDPRGPSRQARRGLVRFLEEGGGLVLVHFANGAFHYSLPMAAASDWPEYRQIARRVWNHQGQSGHDALGPFHVNVAQIEHPLIKGLRDFDVVDELYFNQEGDQPIEPLITARSKVTSRDEPLAWCSQYGKGRIFQTLLGHSEKTYDVFEPREMLRRAVAWAAGRQVLPLEPAQDPVEAALNPVPPAERLLPAGRFGHALDARMGAAVAPGNPGYKTPPITVECWARLFQKQNYNILVASELKSSPTHWELFSMAGSGHLTAYLPGHEPDHVRSNADVCDGAWHHVALIYEADRARLYVDGREAASQALRFKGGEPTVEGLAMGTLVGREIGCTGLIDEVRISRGARQIGAAPHAALAADSQTIGLWRFDAAVDRALFPDESSLQNHARLAGAVAPPAAARQGPIPEAGPHYEAVDQRLKTLLIDRSAGDVYMAVKPDCQGRLFVGGKEAVFVFEPDGTGGYLPRQKLLSFPKDSIIIGLEWRGDDLYVLADNALYLVPEGRTRREGLAAKRLVWGLPLDLHVSFHCLAWGPEGDLYLNHGDPLLNYGDYNRPDHFGHWTLFTRPEGTKVPYTGVGAVLRVRPDGSNLRVVATGLRGPVGLAFDSSWNLFTNENDHESRADLYAPAKLMFVSPHVDFGWPRGWMASRAADRADLLEPMISTLGRGVPCDMAWYEEPLLPQLRGCLLMDRWDRSAINAYPVASRGSAFQAEELPFVVGKNLARPVGIGVSREGLIFGTALYLTANVGSPDCASDLFMIAPGDAQDMPQLEPLDLPRANEETLWRELSSSSWERRRQAHVEILRRGGGLLVEARKRVERTPHDEPAMLHLPWLAAAGGAEARPILSRLAREAPAPVRLQALRALAGVLAEPDWQQEWTRVLQVGLEDPEPRVQLAAASLLFDGEPAALAGNGRILAAVERLATAADTYLRQTAARLLARVAPFEQLARMSRSNEAPVRLAAALAAGTRLTVPGNHMMPPASLRIDYTVPNAIFTQSFADAAEPVDLKKLGRTGSFTMAELWRATTRTPEQLQLAGLLARLLDDEDNQVRLQAAWYLSLLRDESYEPAITRAWVEVRGTRVSGFGARPVQNLWLAGPFEEPAAGPLKPAHGPEQGAIDLAAEYAGAKGKLGWRLVHRADGRFEETGAPFDRASHYVHFRLDAFESQLAALDLATSGRVLAWHNGRAQEEAAALGPGQRRLFLQLQPGSNDLLLRVAAETPAFELAVSLRAAPGVTAAAPARVDSAALAARLKEAAAAGAPEALGEEFLNVDWSAAARQGSSPAGRALFGRLGCSKCHAITADQASLGAPSLAEAKRRFTVAHLVESIMIPSKQVAEPFRATTLATSEGQTITGLVITEDDQSLEVLLPDTTRKLLRKGQVEDRARVETSPMPARLVKTPEELRDLLAYLLSDVPLPP
jgi:putative heme-binding domain-containing protein